MREYLADRLVRIGLGILIIGSAPLFGIILLAKLGVWPDPNPNPIGPGLLFYFSLWPGAIILGLGIRRASARRKQSAADR
ncbi:MAG: hypothetical protein U0V70_10045 [Terriglobia bacterium]